MDSIFGRIETLYLGVPGEHLVKQPRPTLQAELDGFKGDRHGSFERESWGIGDKQPAGVVRRNERQWSAVSQEELAKMSQEMDLFEPVKAGSIGVNLCISGVPNLSQLPKGTIFKFPSNAELMVEEYNPPCKGVSKKIASLHTTISGEPLKENAFSEAAKFSRGLVGVIEVAGEINEGDQFEVLIYEPPRWLSKIYRNSSQ